MRALFLLPLLALLLCSAPARADWGDLRLGGTASWQVLRTGRLGAWGELGLSDFAALRLEGDAAYGPVGWQGMAALGPTFYFDVATWVPAATVALGVANVHSAAVLRAVLRGEMRRYVAPHLGLGLGIAGEYLNLHGGSYSLIVSVSLFREL